MCIGESMSDSLNGAELMVLSAAEFGAYRLQVRDNEDGLNWAVLTPRNHDDVLPEITICRIDPCILVMLEDRFARRQFRSLSTVEEALAFVQSIVDVDLSAARLLH